MCHNIKRITNQYTGDSLYVKCGHCPACLMEKANHRASRIKDEYNPNSLVLFVTLTYDRMSCPFVKFEDVLAHKDLLPLYRAHTSRKVPAGMVNGKPFFVEKRTYKQTKLADIVMPDYSDTSNLPFLQKFGKRIGIAYYKDLQDFYKRLRINLIRKYSYYGKFKAYSCSEYGSQTKRPHFHLLLFIEPNYEQIFRSAVVESWPFASKSRTKEYIELARDAASYVASYVNCNSSLCKFLSQNFKPKHSYSKDFGFGNQLYSLDSLLSLLSKRDLSYTLQRGGEEQSLSSIPIPKYVVARYFPIFKGYSRLSDIEVLQFVQSAIGSHTRQVGDVHAPLYRFDRKGLTKINWIDYSEDDYRKICVRLTNAYNKFARHFGYSSGKDVYGSPSDYAHLYLEMWRCYRATCFRLWRTDASVCELYKFDNINDLISGVIHSPDSLNFFKNLVDRGSVLFLHPNDFPQNVRNDENLCALYDKKDKTRKLINYVMSKNGHWV